MTLVYRFVIVTQCFYWLDHQNSLFAYHKNQHFTFITMTPDNKSIKSYALIILLLLVFAWVTIRHPGFTEESFLLGIGEKYACNWWFPPLIILLKAVLYTFAFPGSIMYIFAGLFYKPFSATLIITAGGVLGAIGAYFVSAFISGGARKRIESSKAFAAMQQQSDWLTLCAVRILPGFPHSIINYGAGILKIPLPVFITTATVGFAAKGFLYASAIYQAARADELQTAGRFEMAMPLVCLALLFIIGKFLRRKLLQ
mgnify:CR=1 FL=1